MSSPGCRRSWASTTEGQRQDINQSGWEVKKRGAGMTSTIRKLQSSWLRIAAVIVASAGLVAVLASTAVGQEEPDISGDASITIADEEKVIPAGFSIRFSLTDPVILCGSALVGQQGEFSLLDPSCAIPEGDEEFDLDVVIVEFEAFAVTTTVTDPAAVKIKFEPLSEGVAAIGTIRISGTPALSGTPVEFRKSADASVCATTNTFTDGVYAADLSECLTEDSTDPIFVLLPDSGLPSQQIPAFDATALIDLDFTALQRGGAVVFIDSDGTSTPFPAGISISFSRNQETCGSVSLGENGVYGLDLTAPCAENEEAIVQLVSEPLIQAAIDLGGVRDLPIGLGSQNGGSPLFGTVTNDQGPLQEGAVVTFSTTEGQDCGNASVEAQGGYVVVLRAPCAPGSPVTVTVSGDNPGRSADEIPPVGHPRRLNITLEPQVTTTEAPTAQQLQAAPLLDSDALQLILVVLITGAVAVLAGILIARTIERWQSYELAKSAHPSLTPDQLAEFFDARLFSRTVVEGLVLSMVVITLVILAVTGKVTNEGTVSVLAAIIGYAAGRATSPK